jgi:hypothetical protein
MHAADHEPVFVKLAKTLIVQGTHDAGFQALSQEGSALSDILPSSIHKLPLFFIGAESHSLPKISPLYIRVMLEVAGAAIITTSMTGEPNTSGRPIVSLIHLGIEPRQLLKQGVF